MWKIERSDELNHHGIPDMKWGKRRFQNYDGTYTPEGRIRYGIGDGREKSRKAFEEKISGENSEKYSTESYRKLRKGKYKDLIDTLDKDIVEKRDAAQNAWYEYVDSGKHFFDFKRNKEERRAAGEKFDKAYNDMWDEFFSCSEKYIQERFTKEQWDDARAFVYDYSELWDRNGGGSPYLDFD